MFSLDFYIIVQVLVKNIWMFESTIKNGENIDWLYNLLYCTGPTRILFSV